MREAIARAAFERREAMAREGGKGRVGGEFLDVSAVWLMFGWWLGRGRWG